MQHEIGSKTRQWTGQWTTENRTSSRCHGQGTIDGNRVHTASVTIQFEARGDTDSTKAWAFYEMDSWCVSIRLATDLTVS